MPEGPLQSFKYDVPAAPSLSLRERRQRRDRGPRLRAALALTVMLGGLVWGGLQAAPAAMDLLIGRPAIADEKSKQADALAAEGEKSLAASQYAGARQRFGSALALAPTRLAAWDRARLASWLEGAPAPTPEGLVPDPAARGALLLALAKREREAGRPAAARPWLDAAIALAPDAPAVHAALGDQLAAEGDVAGALKAYDVTMQRDPGDMATAAARFALGLAAGDVDTACRKAVADFEPRVGGPAATAEQIGLVEAWLHMGLSPEEVRRRIAKAAPQLGPAARDLVLGRAYLRHYRANPNWHRESFDRVLAACADVQRAGAGATPGQRQAAQALLVDAHDARAKRFLDRSDVEAARQEVERAIRLSRSLSDASRYADLQVERSHLLTLGARQKEAMRALDAALAADPHHPCRREAADMQAGLGMTLLSAGKTQAAIGHLKRAVALAPDDDGLLARCFQAMGGARDPGSAAAACAQAARIADPGTALARIAHGLSQAKKPKEAKALLAVAGVRKVGPGRMAEIRAEVSRAEGQRTRARDALLQAIEHRPAAELWLRLGAVEAELADVRGKQGKGPLRDGHQKAALDAYRHAVAIAPDGPAPTRALEATRAIVKQLDAAGHGAAAEALAARGRVLAPNDPVLALDHAEVLMRLKRWAPAEAACAAGLAGITNPADKRWAALQLAHGQVLRKLGKPAAAVEALKKGLAEEAAAPPPRCADLWYELAFAHADAKQREEALNAARQYVFWSMHDQKQAKRVPAIQALELGLTK